MKIHKYVILFAMFVFTCGNLFSYRLFHGEDRVTGSRKDPFTISPFIGINYNIYSKPFQTYDEKFICYDFINGKGLGINYGLKAFYWINQEIGLSPGISYSELSGKFSKTVNDIPINNEKNEIEFLNLEKKQIDYKAITFDLLFCYNIPDIDLYLILGPAINYNQKISFKYSETILNPSSAFYLDGSKSRTLQEIDYPDYKSINLLVKGGIGFCYQLSKYVYIDPEIMYAFPLSNPADKLVVSSVQFSLGLRLNLL
jgi:hypothetical protein